MAYALNLGENGRVLSATDEKHAPSGAALVDALPDGDIADYRYTNGAFVRDPLPKPQEPPDPVAELAGLVVDLAIGLEEVRLTGGRTYV